MAAIGIQGRRLKSKPGEHTFLAQLTGAVSGITGRWILLLVGSVLLSVLFRFWQIPAAALFAGVVTGIAVNSLGNLAYPRHFSRAGQAILGMAIGLMFTTAALEAISAHLLPILLVTAGTLILSLASGLLFSRWTQIKASTGLLSMTAGGAAGITAIALEFEADVGLVAIMQYLRVILVMISLPLVVLFVFHDHSANTATLADAHLPASWAGSLLLLLPGAPFGIWLARKIHITAPYLLGPLLLTLLLTLLHVHPTRALPGPLLEAAYLLIGWQAGLQLSISRLRLHLRLIPRALLIILVLNLCCALLGVLLAHLVGVSDLDGYLATAPGALYAAVAVSMAAHGNVLFVLGAHLIRLLMMLLIMPPLARKLLDPERNT
ncbi:AbrB family transcriptional regulator [Acidithiobacillus sp.]|uniref:AbrB family transcriptional regulator n=1 Tax=Acidithiobacillus sp. TaxID=1872118 RepID=UPI002621474F|nr:AbrB family transcriptional regulator [Acidithiobacillus sp.]MDD5278467.1 AbrB family transcriptional regulator [Acidithiobacillus sp.]